MSAPKQPSWGKDLPTLSGAERRQFLHDVQVIFQDPHEVYNPFYRVDHALETPIAKFGPAASKDGRPSFVWPFTQRSAVTARA